jgi:hypothetical protein
VKPTFVRRVGSYEVSWKPKWHPAGLIAEITPERIGGPGYVLTRRGEAELARYLRKAA